MAGAAFVNSTTPDAMTYPFEFDSEKARKTVRQIFRWTNDRFCAGDFRAVEHLLTEIDEASLDENYLVGCLMACQPIKTSLAFQGFAERARRRLGPIIGHAEADTLLDELVRVR
jgi:hypothetical protein